jgi:hypothetical protein
MNSDALAFPRYDLPFYLAVQSVPITTNVEFEALSWRDVFDTTLCDKVRHLLATGRWFSTVQETSRSFDELKYALMNSDALAFPRYDLPFYLAVVKRQVKVLV